ncbi:MAG: undecaprenyl-diphosphatase, partial [Armatimonadetes bacterium]|nr:undecaprenyl-diphosphatase [Armatimonadota bacterium]
AVIGLWQALARVPGASRSGSTIAGGLFAGFDRPTAAKFSFLLSVPSVFGAGVYKLVKDVDKIAEAGVVETVVATLVAFATGYAAIAFLIRYLQTHSLALFVVYRIMLGGTIAALVLQGIID